MPRIRVNDVELSYADEGSGPPLVLLHGWSMSGRFFERQIEPFAARHRVIVPDYRGHGESEKVLSGHTIETYAADVRALLDVLEIRDPILLGWSMGVMVAYEVLAGIGADACPGLIVAEQGPSDFAWPDYPAGTFTAADLVEAHKLLQTDQPALASDFVDLMLHADDPATKAWMVVEMLKVPPAIASAILLDQTLRDDRERIGLVKTPTLVLFGEDPKLTDPDAGRWIHGQIPGSTFAVIPASSHCPFYEQADIFNDHVLTFTAACGTDQPT